MVSASSNSKLQRLPPARRVPQQPPRLSLPAGRPMLDGLRRFRHLWISLTAAMRPPKQQQRQRQLQLTWLRRSGTTKLFARRCMSIAALGMPRSWGLPPFRGAAPALSGRSTVAETCNQMHQRCAVWLQGASDAATRLEDSVRDQLTAFVKLLRDKLEGAPPARPGHESGEPVLPTPRASQCCAPLAGKGQAAGLCRVTGALGCSDTKNPGPEVPGKCRRHCLLKAKGCPAHGPKGAAASAGAVASESAAGRSVPRAAAAGVSADAAAAGATSPSAPRSAANVAASGKAAASVGPAEEGGSTASPR